MKQVTGKTNSLNTQKKVSIQLALDGHSFSLPEGYADSVVEEVELLTELTLLVPRELYAGGDAAKLFAANGQSLPEGMTIVVCESDERPDVVALVALPQAMLDELQNNCAHPRLTTPLLYTPTVTEPTLYLCDTGLLIYIKVYDLQLRLAEVVPAPDVETLNYLMQRVETLFDLSRYTIKLDMRRNDKGRTACYKKYFKKFVCV